MPYSEKAERFFRARAHGWTPSDPKLRKLSPSKAGELLEHSKTTKQREGVEKAMAK